MFANSQFIEQLSGVLLVVLPPTLRTVWSLFSKEKADHHSAVYFLSFGIGIEDSHLSAKGAGYSYVSGGHDT